jgi:hypothetical protein
MKTTGNGRTGLADRRGDNGELFGGEVEGRHLSGGQQQTADQPDAPKSAEPHGEQAPDQVRYQTMKVRREPEVPIVPEQTPIRLKQAIVQYPLLQALLAQRGLPLKGIWTLGDVAKIFDVSKRTIQDWIRDRKLIPRDLPGRGRFLSEDLEAFLQNSRRKANPEGEEN